MTVKVILARFPIEIGQNTQGRWFWRHAATNEHAAGAWWGSFATSLEAWEDYQP